MSAANFIVYDKRTGAIIRRGSCPLTDLPLQARSRDHGLLQVETLEVHDVLQRVNLETGELEEIPDRVENLTRLVEKSKRDFSARAERAAQQTKQLQRIANGEERDLAQAVQEIAQILLDQREGGGM